MHQPELISHQKIRDYYYVTKPNVISLLVFTGAASYVATAAWNTSIFTLVIVSSSVWLGSAAANTIGSYFDRDIDAIMARTRLRPIPTGRIPPGHAAAYGIVLLLASVSLSLVFLSRISALFMVAGFLDYTIVYSFLLKRRTALNIVLGGFSGVMPVLVGYFAVVHPATPLVTGLFAGFLVFFWIPEHIWALAIRFKKDYERAKVPMLPVVVSEKLAVQLVAATSIVMVGYSLIPMAFPALGLHFIYIACASVLGAAIIALNLWLLRQPSAQRAWTVFKFSSPYLFFIFIAIVADVLVFAR
ncbi:MAG: heme o synthase [Nitrososphaerales archaeon]